MGHEFIPHFQNDSGCPSIKIGAKEFMCIGATPPFDHPHIFINMGAANEAICPYCSTHYVHNPHFSPYEADPAEAAFIKASQNEK